MPVADLLLLIILGAVGLTFPVWWQHRHGACSDPWANDSENLSRGLTPSNGFTLCPFQKTQSKDPV
jgi:hypothetical protein